MKKILLSAASAAALIGLPVMAQAANQTSMPGNNNTAATASQTQAPNTQMQSSNTMTGATNGTTSANSGQLVAALKKAGAVNENSVQGSVYRAQTSDGVPVLVVVTPASLKTQAPANFYSKDFTNQLQKAGLKDVQQVQGAEMAHALMSNHNDHQDVLAMSGLGLQSNSNSNSNSGSNFNSSQFQKTLTQAGIKADTAFHGKIARVSGNQGPVLMIVGANDVNARQNPKSGNVNVSAVRESFAQAGMKNFNVLDNAHVFQGTTGDDSVYVMTGQSLKS